MLLNALGLLYTFLIAAFFSAGITVTPLTVAWGSIWTYFTFILCIIPGYIFAWMTLAAVILLFAVVVGLLGLLGIGTAAGLESIAKRAGNKRTVNKRRF